MNRNLRDFEQLRNTKTMKNDVINRKTEKITEKDIENRKNWDKSNSNTWCTYLKICGFVIKNWLDHSKQLIIVIIIRINICNEAIDQTNENVFDLPEK